MGSYEWLDNFGLCHRCNKAKCAPGKKYCFDCLDKIKAENAARYNPEEAKKYQFRRREIYREKKEKGICVKCSKPATHGLYCYECYIKTKRHNQKTAERRKIERHERGLIPETRKQSGCCIQCGKKLETLKNGVYCNSCLQEKKAALDFGRGKSQFRRMEQERYNKSKRWREANEIQNV